MRRLKPTKEKTMKTILMTRIMPRSWITRCSRRVWSVLLLWLRINLEDREKICFLRSLNRKPRKEMRTAPETRPESNNRKGPLIRQEIKMKKQREIAILKPTKLDKEAFLILELMVKKRLKKPLR